MSMLGMSFLNEIVIENGNEEPDEILNQLRAKIIKAFERKGGDTERKDGMDIGICCLNKEGTELSFSGAYNPLVIVRANELIAPNLLEEYRELKEKSILVLK